LLTCLATCLPDNEREVRTEEDRIPVMHTTFPADRGRGHSYEPMHRYYAGW
jgi:hypothetical protein